MTDPIFLNVNREGVDIPVREGAPFSCGTEFYDWREGWCARCVKEPTCPVLDTALIETGFTPMAWVDGERFVLGPRRFTCTEFQADEV